MELRNVIAAALVAAESKPSFNSHAGWKLYICVTPQNEPLADATAYAALTWVQITGVGSVGETGTTTNMLTYDTWDDTVVQKAKGLSNAGDPSVEVARDPDDAGQVALRAAALTNWVYAFKMEANDKPTSEAGAKPTIHYNRGYVSGPTRPNGRNEDFDVEVFQLALVQKEIVVAPVDPA